MTAEQTFKQLYPFDYLSRLSGGKSIQIELKLIYEAMEKYAQQYNEGDSEEKEAILKDVNKLPWPIFLKHYALQKEKGEPTSTTIANAMRDFAKQECEMLLPTDKEVEDWYVLWIGKSCSASSAIYKFRNWLKERSNKILNNF